ncbi:MAG TPA: hypothetical protein VGL77_20295 [Armatimonadota bacterium]|jgi:hypothetical protein
MSFNAYEVDKLLFTDDDFDTMDWHDNPIHAIAFGPGKYELSFDIDYVFKWEEPLHGEQNYRFWISPATLVFEDVYDLKIEQPYPYYAGLTIANIAREEIEKARDWPADKKVWQWTLECLESAWAFSATGYRQFIRKPPILFAHQRFDYDERQGYGFECPQRS